MDRNMLSYLISIGKISEVKTIIASDYKGIIESKVALSVLVSLCRLVSQEDNDLVDDIFYITNICCENLPTLGKKEKENFLLSLYHIVKYLCKHQLHDEVLKLLDFVKEYAVDEKYKSGVYNYFIVLFHNNIFQNAKELDGDLLYQFIKYAIDFNLLSNVDDYSEVIKKIKSYSGLFNYPNLTFVHCNDFCTKVLGIFENFATKIQSTVQEVYATLLSLLNINIHFLSLSPEKNFPNLIKIHFQKTCQVMRQHCTHNEYLDCIEILECLSQSMIKDLSDSEKTDLDILIECNKKLRATIRKRSSNPVVSKTCNQIAKIIRQFFEYYQNCKHLWTDHLPISIQVEMMRMVEVLALYLSQNGTDIEKCCPNCDFKTDIYHATLLTSYSGILFNHSLRLKISCTKELFSSNLRCLTICCKLINKLKDGNCEKYAQIWRIVGTGIYNIAVVLYRNQNYNYARTYIHLFIKNIFILESLGRDICFPNALGAALNLYGVCCSFLDDIKEAMLYLCLTMLLSTEYRKKALQTWIKIKSNDSENDKGLKSMTVHHILFNQQDEIKQIYSSYVYNKKECEELLMEELMFYNENWRSKIPMSSLCDEFCKISEDPISRTKIFSVCWDKTCFSGSNLIHNVQTTIEKIGVTSNLDIKTCLPILYFILYQCKMNEVIDKNLADMINAHIPNKNTPVQPYEEPPNPNDKCDIVPDYFNMKIDNLLPIYQILDQALEVLEFLLNNLDKLDFDVTHDVNLGGFIKRIAFEFRQQLFNIKMLKTWILYYKFAKYFNNKLETVTSIAFILEYCASKTLEREAENLLDSFDKNDPGQLDIYVTYYINKSTGYLRDDLAKEGYEALKIAGEYLEEVREKNLKICEARILHLKACYLMLPCCYNILDHDENFIVISLDSFVIIGEHFLQTPKCPYLISTLLEISLLNGWMHKRLRLPREVRCYIKDSILLAQKLVLPLRTAQFLSLLAFTDLLDLQYSDCEVKLTGLTNMLCCSSNIPYEKFYTDLKKVYKELESPDCELSELNQSLSGIQIVLEAPKSQRSNPNNLMASPSLRKKPFAFPEFMKHSVNCDCFMCSNCEYQKLILDAIHIEALLTFYQNVENGGKEYFKGGLAVYNKFCEKSKLIKFENMNIFLRVHKNIDYCTFLLDYSYFLCRKNNFPEANKIVDYIFTIISRVKYVNPFFWNELMLQKYNLIDFEKENIENKSHKTPNKLQVPLNINSSTTPQGKISQANINLSISPIKVPQPVKSFKKLKFDLSEDEKEDNSPKTPETNKNIFFTQATKTPAPATSKIKIYSPKTVKAKRITTRSANKTPSVVKKTTNNKQIEERMKLLTEKLKSENKALEISDKENDVPKVRKKLLDDLSDVTESIDKLTIDPTKKKTGKGTQNLKKDCIDPKSKTVERKKYSRIKVPSSSSSSDNSSDKIGCRKSTRTKKT